MHLLGWGIFNLFVVAMLVLDLKVFHRDAHEIKVKEALWWSAFWITLALLFNVGIYAFMGSDAALRFLTGYLIEKSLSVDNLFVFLLIFSYFKVPAKYQHKTLFWGIVGALVMRTIFIFCGVALLERFEWIMYIFGAILVVSGVKLVKDSEKEVDPSKNVILRIFRKFVPVSDKFEGDKFFVRQAGKLVATPLFVVLLVVESTDVVFAVDSIPAILAITLDTFIIYTSNVFAILGLRALYFALAGMMDLFHLMHYGLGGILVFIGIKMLLHHYLVVPIGITLAFIAIVLTASIVASIMFPKKK
jgi:tellurite resistance protein TerC